MKMPFFMSFRENWTIFQEISQNFVFVNLQRSINDHLDRCSQLGRTCWRRFRICIQWNCWIRIYLIASWFWRNFFRYPWNPDSKVLKMLDPNPDQHSLYALGGDCQWFLSFIILSFSDPDWISLVNGSGSGLGIRVQIWTGQIEAPEKKKNDELSYWESERPLLMYMEIYMTVFD